MRKAAASGMILAFVLTGCSTSASKNLGCSTALSSAEDVYNSGVTGIGSTTNIADAVNALRDVKSKMDDFATVNGDSAIKVAAQEASTRSGKIRVALTDGTSPVDPADIKALQADFLALDNRCKELS
jgi:hypothetical protein